MAAAEQTMSPGGGSHESGGDQSPRSISNVREQDRYLPIANISRIMKKALSANGKIAKDAKETVQECVSEFISFFTSEVTPRDLQRREMYLLRSSTKSKFRVTGTAYDGSNARHRVGIHSTSTS